MSTKLRAAKEILGEVLPHGVVSEELSRVALRTVARLSIYLESSLAEAKGEEGEWPEGPCKKSLCSLRDGHDGECGL